MLPRILEREILDTFHKGKAIIISGPRQVGKTTLIQKILSDKPHLFLDGDDSTVVQLLSDASTYLLKRIIGENKIVFIDEAQKIPGIGNTLKLITDKHKQVQLIVSGSSSLFLHNHAQETLTGRKFEYSLFPISWPELEAHVGVIEAEQQLENRLVFGMYPDLFNYPERQEQVLQNLSRSYLYQDVLTMTGIRKPELLERLLIALALQLGSEVSFGELSQLLGVDKNTIIKYIDLLEKSYILFTLRSFSRNLRNELKNSKKIYFVDNGIRNSIIQNFAPLALRADKGALWENFLISERRKHNAYQLKYCNSYFWRTRTQQEIDYIEESNGLIQAWEFKWNNKTKVKFPESFQQTYLPTSSVIHRGNFTEFTG
jgi:uncharacterized protein